MGFFTWTFANRKIYKNKNGQLSNKSKLPYNGYGCVLCPDGTVIEEQCYEGYGRFADNDVYELVVDWNKEHLLEILEEQNYRHGIYHDVARIYREYGHTMTQQFVDEYVRMKGMFLYLQSDWKRDLGIHIACGNNQNIPFPIKIVSVPRPRLSYDKLPASITCQ